MALNPDEMRRKRQAKAQRRKARQRKILLLTGLIVAAILVIGIILLIALPKNPPQDTPAPTETTPTQSSEPTDPTQPADSGNTVIHFVAAGDLNINDATVASGGMGYDYSKAFMDVAPVLAQADLTAVNFEGNLCGSPYGTSTGSAPQSMAMALNAAGVDIVQLANSYAINRGLGGLAATIDSVRAAGMEPVGAFKNEADFQRSRGYSLFMVNGIKIAVVAFTKGMDGMTLPPGSENCVNLLYVDYDSTYQQVDRDGISRIMDAVSQEKPDLTIALVHWGSEFNDTVSSSQYAICNLLKEKGANAIIGTHSHYIEKMEYDPESGTFVAYGLGDFFSDAARAGSQYGVLLDLEITKFQDGQTKITGYSYTPIYSLAQGDAPMRVVRIREAMLAYENGHIGGVTKEIYDDMAYSLWRIEARIAGE